MTPFETKTDSVWREHVCTDRTVACKSDVDFSNMIFFVCFVFQMLTAGDALVVSEWLGGPSPPPNDINNRNFPTHPVRSILMVIASHGTSLTKKGKRKNNNWRIKMKMSSRNKKRKRNSSLRGDSMRRQRLVKIARRRNDHVQTHKRKRQTTGVYGWQMYKHAFVGFLKGYHFFAFYLFFTHFFSKDISRSRYLGCWNVLGIHSTLQTSRLESGSNDYCLAHPGFFFFFFLLFFFFWKPLYYHTDKKDTLNKNRNTTTKHSENSTCPTMFFFLP